MSIPIFNFTRAPGVKTRVKIEADTLVTADDSLVLIGNMAATGSTATALVPMIIDNFGDKVAAQVEVDAKFGAGSQLGEMVIAAIQGVAESDLAERAFPKITCIPMISTSVSTDLAAALAANLTLPMPYVVTPFPGTDTTGLNSLKAHLNSISADDRGRLGQFGSFGYMALDGLTAAATAAGLAAATEKVCMPWLRDGAVTKANKIHAVSAAYAAVCASLGVPFLPLDGVKIGGIVAPAAQSDRHTPGDAGTEALGLSAGIVPLMSNLDGSISISRSLTTRRPTAAIEETAYFDMQDWQVLYFFRKNCFAASSEETFRRAKASVTKAKALNSRFLKIAKDLETLEMFQHVDLLAGEFVFARSLTNRSAFVFSAPANVIPGFHNKGVELIGTTKFDQVIA
jgi:phage tail sheath gpL-like